MANPRKFSEKIALHNQKQAEETAAFEKIMREVSDATNKVNSGNRRSRVKAIPKPVETVESSLKPNQQSLGSFRSGSLPNVAAPQTPSAEPETVKVDNPEETTLATQYGLGGRSGGTSPSRATGRERGRVSSVGPMRRPADRKHDTSPYGSSVYLSPPPDSSWRRTNSDSALHQSCGEPPMSAPQHQHHPHQNHNRDAGDMTLLTTLGMNTNDRPRSSCDIPRIPHNNNVYYSVSNASAGAGSLTCELQVPGGSLPDLTALHYPAQPQYNNVNRPEPEHRTTYYGMGASAAASPAGSPASSSSPVAHHQLDHHHDHHHDHQLYEPQNHLSVPNTNSYTHRSNKTMSPLDHNWIASSYQSQCSPPSQYSSTSNINIPSPTMVHSPGSPVESPQTDCSNLHQLLQPFEQFTMMDPPASSYSPSYLSHSAPQTSNTHTYTQTVSGAGARGRDPVAGAGLLPPAAIPDIILTDYSGELDAGIFGGEEAQLRAGLDLDDLNLLEEPSALLPDSAVEHEFRLDRL